MKRKIFAISMIAVLAASMFAGCGKKSSDATSSDVKTYKVGIVQYVDDASLNQIVNNLESELDALGEANGVKFDYEPYYANGQADSTTINQIVAELINDEVDVIVPIATPTALICQAATEDNEIPVVFSAVSDPVGAELVASLEAPGSNITGTSDYLNTNAVMDLMFVANPDIKSVGLLYDKSQDSSSAPIKEAKEYLDAKGIKYVEKTGTTNAEIMLAADALVAANVDAVFTPTDNTVMTAELGIYEKFVDAKIPHYCGADSFALNGAFCGYGVDYAELGKETAKIVCDILVNGADPASTPVVILDNGAATINTETAAACGIDYKAFESLVTKLTETTTKEEFE